MPSHNSTLGTVECGYCGSPLPAGHAPVAEGEAAYCSSACASRPDEAASRHALGDIICTNCESACHESQRIVFSEDGLPFCGSECADRYPKMVADPQVRRVLFTAAAGMLLAACVALLGIAERLPTLTRHP